MSIRVTIFHLNLRQSLQINNGDSYRVLCLFVCNILLCQFVIDFLFGMFDFSYSAYICLLIVDFLRCSVAFRWRKQKQLNILIFLYLFHKFGIL